MKLINKDITTIELGVIAHGVNCRYKMGSGVALAIRKKFPKAYKQYMENVGGVDLLNTADIVQINDDLFVANCYTQTNYGYDKGVVYADIRAIYKSLMKISEFCVEKNLPLYMPKIGCGLGGLSWDGENGVKRIVEEIERKKPGISITICEF